jgi:trk system potassium uptake protein
MMKLMRILGAIGDITRIFSPAFMLPIVVAFVMEPYETRVFGLFKIPFNVLPFLATGLLTTAFWIAVKFVTRKVSDEDLLDREAYLTVGLGWLVLTVFAMLPFMLAGVLTSPVDAFFETMSGFTTTGATTIEGDLDAVPKSVMMWRAQLQYIGGMGIIVLSIAVLARLTHGGMQLLAAEAPGPTVTKLRPKLAQTAKTLWMVYAAASAVLLAILLVLFLQHGMGFIDAAYDALIHTFTTLSTGGFSNHSASVAYYDSWLVEAVIILFMIFAGTNFSLHYYAMHGEWRRLWRDAEWRFFMLSILVSTAVISGLVWRMAGYGVAAGQASLRGVSFTSVSLLTSTGYSTANFDAWPESAKLLLLVMMITGGTAGSTAGGIKHVRILLLFKVLRRQLQLLLHPRAVIPIRFGGRVIKEETLMAVVAFFFAFITLVLAGALVLATTDPLFEDRPVDAISAAASAMSNTGPGLGVVGPAEGYWDLLPHSKMLLAMLMWAGRLEVFTALLLFNPGSWHK